MKQCGRPANKQKKNISGLQNQVQTTESTEPNDQVIAS
jgi:hypothetical protein